MIESIDHFVITVADVETTLAFYERVLGFTRSMTPRNPAALKFGSQKINVHRKDRPFEPKAKRPSPARPISAWSRLDRSKKSRLMSRNAA